MRTNSCHLKSHNIQDIKALSIGIYFIYFFDTIFTNDAIIFKRCYILQLEVGKGKKLISFITEFL